MSTLTRDEAATALGAIDAADKRVRTMQFYAECAPFLILWGSIWLVANAVSDLAPPWGARTWLAGIVVGSGITLYWVVRNAVSWKQRYPQSVQENKAFGQRAALLGVTLMTFFPAVFAIITPLSARQGNALMSLIWAFVYMTAGAFVGWRLFAIGAITAAGILFGYFFVHAHYGLWMGCVAGGALIAGGLWLRKI